ncbi:MAG: hypothetical protein AB8B48_14830 [Pseudomonadales bacterium]
MRLKKRTASCTAFHVIQYDRKNGWPTRQKRCYHHGGSCQACHDSE